MRQQTIAVPATLTPWFAQAAVTTAGPGEEVAVLEEPDHATTLTWRPGTNDVLVIGPRSRARYHAAQAGALCLRLSFRPGRTAEFLGRPVRDFLDRTVALRADAAGAILQVLNDSAPAPGAALRILNDTVRTPGGIMHEPLIREAAALLTTGLPVTDTARRLHLSERHLRNIFVAALGLTPSRFVGIERVRSVLRHIDGSLPELARRAGYYDQSHMTAEFRRLMGVPPHAFRSRRWPAGQPCGPLDTILSPAAERPHPRSPRTR